jgi:hypothetical protein
VHTEESEHLDWSHSIKMANVYILIYFLFLNTGLYNEHTNTVDAYSSIHILNINPLHIKRRSNYINTITYAKNGNKKVGTDFKNNYISSMSSENPRLTQPGRNRFLSSFMLYLHIYIYMILIYTY